MLRIAAILSLLLSGCSYNSPASQVAPGSQVGGTGDITYEHRPLSGGTHMVIVTVRPGLAETETSMSQRSLAFGTTFASQTCPKGFDFVNNPDPDRPVEAGFAQRQRTYTFRCRV